MVTLLFSARANSDQAPSIATYNQRASKTPKQSYQAMLSEGKQIIICIWLFFPHIKRDPCWKIWFKLFKLQSISIFAILSQRSPFTVFAGITAKIGGRKIAILAFVGVFIIYFDQNNILFAACWHCFLSQFSAFPNYPMIPHSCQSPHSLENCIVWNLQNRLSNLHARVEPLTTFLFTESLC